MQRNKSHSVTANAVHYFLAQIVRYHVMTKMTPPYEHIGIFEQIVGQSELGLTKL